MVFCIRKDLKMQKGKICAQVAHAVLGIYKKNVKRENPKLYAWEMTGQAKITLQCPSLEELLIVEEKAKEKGILTHKVIDAGRTQIAAGSITVLALGPAENEMFDDITTDFKLY
eukprot:TRINITY_DN400_c0_g3_i4.p1 TRINITY_DN400_c0_g3~~TRINITY_DN400_c0_g3_i4.p1  ORF type:complete len:114 (+),score=44.85 TRINITY_DN400_c0_g3_i4:464-805(+)